MTCRARRLRRAVNGTYGYCVFRAPPTPPGEEHLNMIENTKNRGIIETVLFTDNMQRRDAMGIGLTILIILLIVYLVTDFRKELHQPYKTMRCPTCGEEARIYGDCWDCTWCGDSGKVEWK